MIRIKSLSLPLITSMIAASVAPSSAQVGLSLSSNIAYRQNKKTIDFRGGSFDIDMRDGDGTYIGGCSASEYVFPGEFTNICAPGTSGYLSSGSFGGTDPTQPYLLVTGLVAATIIAPYRANEISLVAAPASTLPRPSGGFEDDSAAVYYNLHTNSVSEYGLTGYTSTRNYSANQRAKFDSDVVPGAYRYLFPRKNSTQTIPVTAVIYPMAEGLATKNKKTSGFQFITTKNKWTSDGFMEISYRKPNTIEWKGLTPNIVLAAVDDLFFSFRPIVNPNNPNSAIIRGEAIFPAFVSGADPRIALANPYITKFTMPPVIPAGARGMIELELQRSFQTGGVTYDFSNRKFQIPIAVIDRYTEYQAVYLAKSKKKKILEDADGDGYNNLTEWILDSIPSDPLNIPIPPVPVLVEPAPDDLFGDTYFGFNVDIKKDTDPKVTYTLQRSKDFGATWSEFVTDPSWFVDTVEVTVNNVTFPQIQVRSRTGTPLNPTQPPGTATDVYRLKIAQAK